jgi:hypothetical protein
MVDVLIDMDHSTDFLRHFQDGGQLVELPSEPSASERVGP